MSLDVLLEIGTGLERLRAELAGELLHILVHRLDVCPAVTVIGEQTVTDWTLIRHVAAVLTHV